MLIPSYYDAPDHLEGSVPMRGDDPRNDAMFSYVTPEARVRPDHPLRPIRRMTDAALARLSPRFDRLYSTTGRPSIPPEQLLRALLLQMLYSIRSERLLMEELDYSVLFRWFVGLSLDDPIWDATTFTKNRDRLLDGDIADAFFAEVLAAIKPEGLLSDEHFTVDGTLLEAWASHKSFKPKGTARRPPDDPRNPTVNFHGRDAAERHASVDDRSRRAAVQESRRPRSEARLSRASADRESPRLHRRHRGDGRERHGRTRRRDRHARRVAADARGASRWPPTKRTTRAPGSPPSAGCGITPHVAQNGSDATAAARSTGARRDTPATR